MNRGQVRWGWRIVAVLCVYACGGEPAPKRRWTAADHGQPKQAQPDRVPHPSEDEAGGEPPTLRAARALWTASCSGCHGRDGKGLGEARPPGVQLPDLSSEKLQNDRSDRQLALSIRDGRGMMPGFGKQLTEQGIAVLVQFIRTLPAGSTSAGRDAGSMPEPVAPAPR
jgi:mono/diheme cytochrome c family protein